MTLGMIILFALVLGYLIAAGYFAARQRDLVFQPKASIAATPASVGLEFEEIVIQASDRVRLHAWILPAPSWAKNPGWVLHLHGAATNLGDMLPALRFWHELGFAVLAIDYRGYGQSEGRPSEAGLYRDARAAWDHLVGELKVNPARILVVAVSLGVSVAVELATRVQPAGLVLEAGFTRVAELAVRRYPWLPSRQLTRIGLAAEDRVAGIRCPKLFVHSLEDRTVPITLGRKLFQRAAPPKKMLRILGRHAHACEDGGPRFTEGVKAFLASLPHEDEVA